MERLKVGLIGLGAHGWHHGRVFNESCYSDLVAVADINPKLKKKVIDNFNCEFYTDYKEMLKNKNFKGIG